MHSNAFAVPFSPVAFAGSLVGVLAVTYLALIATVMSYAALTIEFSQSVRSDEAQVATLEAQYLGAMATITGSDYASLGYAKPVATAFVPSAPTTALR